MGPLRRLRIVEIVTRNLTGFLVEHVPDKAVEAGLELEFFLLFLASGSSGSSVPWCGRWRIANTWPDASRISIVVVSLAFGSVFRKKSITAPVEDSWLRSLLFPHRHHHRGSAWQLLE